jgi:hypothetical protein
MLYYKYHFCRSPGNFDADNKSDSDCKKYTSKDEKLRSCHTFIASIKTEKLPPIILT